MKFSKMNSTQYTFLIAHSVIWDFIDYTTILVIDPILISIVNYVGFWTYVMWNPHTFHRWFILHLWFEYHFDLNTASSIQYIFIYLSFYFRLIIYIITSSTIVFFLSGMFLHFFIIPFPFPFRNVWCLNHSWNKVWWASHMSKRIWKFYYLKMFGQFLIVRLYFTLIHRYRIKSHFYCRANLKSCHV